MDKATLIVSLVIGLSTMGCSDDEGCFSDSECGYGLICNRAASTCEAPPGDCNGYCLQQSNCGFEDRDQCIKDNCGASFLQYYRDTYGGDCEQAWLDLMECNGNLTCEEYTEYANEVDPTNGTAPYCEPQLQAKNSEC